MIGEGVLNDEGQTAAPLGCRAVAAGKGEQLVAWRRQVHARGTVTRLAQPSLGQQHHVNIMITDEVADF